MKVGNIYQHLRYGGQKGDYRYLLSMRGHRITLINREGAHIPVSEEGLIRSYSYVDHVPLPSIQEIRAYLLILDRFK